MSNLELWELVSVTAPSITKNAKVGGHEFTAVDPQVQRKNATEQFGPFGIGWGVSHVETEFVTLNQDNVLFVYKAVLWYKWKDVSGEFPITSAVKAMYRTNGKSGYLKIDDDCSKKAATNAVSKGLSHLGFNSDVFEGKYDDEKYVREAAQFVKTAIGPVEAQVIDTLLGEANADRDKFLGHFKVETVKDLPLKDYESATNMLRAKIRKNEAEAAQ